MFNLTMTRADLIRQVLDNLGKLGNDAPSNEDSDKVDRVIDPSVAMLSAMSIYTVDDAGMPGPIDGAIDTAAFLSIAHVVTEAAAPSFNMANDSTIIGLAQQARNTLEIIAAPPRNFRTLRIDAALQNRRRFLYNGSFS